MTAQTGEILYYKGRKHQMFSEPLHDYFELSGEKPSFAIGRTSLSRDYLGTWEIIDDRLYLIDIDAHLRDGTKVTLASLFPEFPDRVFAHWFTGTLRVPEGKMLSYVHMGYGRMHERDFLIRLERGVVVSVEVRENGNSADSEESGRVRNGQCFLKMP